MRKFVVVILMAGLVLSQAGQDKACVNKAKADYNKCYAKAIKYKPGNERKAAIQLCDEILDNDTVDCRQLGKGGHLQANTQVECLNKVRTNLFNCNSAAQSTVDADKDALKSACIAAYNQGIKLCSTMWGDDINSNRKKPEDQRPAPLPIDPSLVDDEPVRLPNNMCVKAARGAFITCVLNANRANTHELRQIRIGNCKAGRNRSFRDCANKAGIELYRRLQGDKACENKAKADYNQCYGKAMKYKPGNDRKAAIQLCDEILDNDTADCRKLTKVAPKSNHHLASWCEWRALASKYWCLGRIHFSGVSDPRNNEAQRCEFNYSLTVAKCPKRRLEQTKGQCLKNANENFVKCQFEVAKMSDWGSEARAAKDTARNKCREEFDREQDECDFKPKAYRSPLIKTTATRVIA